MKENVVDDEESIISSEYYNGSPKGNRKIITPGSDL